MAKVIVERPRFGSRARSKRKGYERRRQRLGWDGAAKREGMKVRSGGTKMLNEHLSPLRRYLAAQVGRPWDKVFAEICRHIDRNSAVQDHVRDHVQDYVAVNVIVHDGRLCHADGHSTGRPLRTPFYVCPRSALLKRNPSPVRWYAVRVKPLLVRMIDDSTALVRYAGAWHVIEWRTLPARIFVPRQGEVYVGRVMHFDELLQRNICREQAEHIYGTPILATSSRPASKREVRRLVNSYPYTNRVS